MRDRDPALMVSMFKPSPTISGGLAAVLTFEICDVGSRVERQVVWS